jgi:predicted nucleotidyltransferase
MQNAAIPADIHQEIMKRLAMTEEEENVRILYAVESGSRAWGFASTNSDYDVRFIYAHDAQWYQAVDLEERRDVIEYEIVDEIDLNGWDVRKALRLFWRSNPSIIEWLQSPIVYLTNGVFSEKMTCLIPSVYSIPSGIYHYRSSAKSTARVIFNSEKVSLKKYFYALRPLLSVRWLETYQTVAPIEFEKLLHLLDGNNALLNDIHELLEKKRNLPELGRSEPVQRIDEFIKAELERLEDIHPENYIRSTHIDELNHLFREVIVEGK